ncbi:MAG: hypothetical protein WBO08_05790, partial [Mycobacterium sp.]
MNKPASLTAGVCSLCITAAMVAVPPRAAAAELPVVQHRSVSVLNQPYELTAASQALQNLLLAAGIPSYNLSAPENTELSKAQLDVTEAREVTAALLAVLGLPSYYLFTTVATLGGLTNFVTGLNLASGNIYKGNWDDVPDNLKKAWDDEVAAVKAVLNLPATLIEETKLRLGNLVPASAPIEGAIVQTDVPTDFPKAQLAETEAPEVTEALLAVLGLPSYYLYTTVATLGGLTNFVTGLNLASGNIYKGNWDDVPDNLKKAWNDEVAAVKALLNLPATLIEETKFRLGNLVPAPALKLGNLVPAPTLKLEATGLSVGTPPVITTDTGTPDTGTPDTGTPDTGTPDTGTPDGGTTARGTTHGGTPDGGTTDTGTPDGGTPDGGTPDTGTPDTGTPDGGTPDGGTPDGGTTARGTTHGGTPD